MSRGTYHSRRVTKEVVMIRETYTVTTTTKSFNKKGNGYQNVSSSGTRNSKSSPTGTNSNRVSAPRVQTSSRSKIKAPFAEDTEVENSDSEDTEVEDSDSEDSYKEDSDSGDSDSEDSDKEDSDSGDSDSEDSDKEDSESEDTVAEDSDADESDIEPKECVHVYLQQLNRMKFVTTIRGIKKKSNYDETDILEFLMQVINCNGLVFNDPEFGKVIQLLGDQRKYVSLFLVEADIVKKKHLRIHGFMPNQRRTI